MRPAPRTNAETLQAIADVSLRLKEHAEHQTLPENIILQRPNGHCRTWPFASAATGVSTMVDQAIPVLSGIEVAAWSVIVSDSMVIRA